MSEHRQSPRYRLRWDAAIILQGQELPLCRGRTHDISLSGVAVLSDFNVAMEGRFTVMLLLPSLHDKQPPQLIEASAQKIYCVHSAEHVCFRTGLRFLKFQDSGQKLLHDRLQMHAPSANFPPPGTNKG